MTNDDTNEKPTGAPAAGSNEKNNRSEKPAQRSGSRSWKPQRRRSSQRGQNATGDLAGSNGLGERARTPAQPAQPQRRSNQRDRSSPRGGNPVVVDKPDQASQSVAQSGEQNRSVRSHLARRPEENRQSESGQRLAGTQNKTRSRRPNQNSRTRRDQNNRTNQEQNGLSRAPSVPRRVRGGIKARSEDGEFGKNWWAKRWLLAMERLMDGARLQRGRRYARMGQVLSMVEANGGIVARVQGSRAAPYKVNIRVAPLTDEQWDKVYDVLADQAIFAAQLLAGEMPPNIEEAFSSAGVSLFPTRGGDLMTDCSCPDWVNPCKHIAAAHYILGDRFDEDPFLLLRMRGRKQDEILQALRLRRTGAEETPQVLRIDEYDDEEEVSSLDENVANFWNIGAGIENFEVNVQPPSISLPILKRLGDPDFASKYSLELLLGSAYESISQTALFLAFTDIPRDDGDNGGNGDPG